MCHVEHVKLLDPHLNDNVKRLVAPEVLYEQKRFTVKFRICRNHALTTFDYMQKCSTFGDSCSRIILLLRALFLLISSRLYVNLYCQGQARKTLDKICPFFYDYITKYRTFSVFKYRHFLYGRETPGYVTVL